MPETSKLSHIQMCSLYVT